MKKIMIICLLVCCIAAQAQKPELLFYKSESGKDFITVEFYTTEKGKYNQVDVIRTDGEKAKSLGKYYQRYQRGDTTIFFYTDTVVKPSHLYQYAFIPYTPDGKKGSAGEPVFAATKVFTAYFFGNTGARPDATSQGVRLYWRLSSIDNIKAIQVFKSENMEGPFSLLSTLPSTDTGYTDEAIAPDKIYYYKLSARNFITLETFESAAFFDRGMPVQKPLAPVLQSVAQTAKGITAEVHTYEPYLASVKLYRKKDGDSTYQFVATQPGADSIVYFTDSAALALAGSNYTYAARAENLGMMLSELSNEIQLYIGKVSADDYAGTFNAVYDNTLIYLYWENPDATQFKIQRIEEGARKPEWLNDGQGFSGSRFTDTAISPGRSYEYLLFPISETGETGKGISATVSTPEDELITNGTLQGLATDKGIVLQWGAIIDSRIAKQKLYRYQPGVAPVVIATTELSTDNYTDTSAKSGEIYRYFLVGIDKQNKEGKAGNEIAVRAR
jgi:hypothetical protein